MTRVTLTPTAPRAEPPRPRAHLLVVDDDPLITTLLSGVLGETGYIVTVAESGQAALDVIGHVRPDLIVCDVNMPGMDGFGLLRALRADSARRAVPLVFLTTRGAREDVVGGLRLGADDYILKPFAIGELVARVEAKLARPPVPADQLPHDPQTGLLSPGRFHDELEAELRHVRAGGGQAQLAVLGALESPGVGVRLGPAVAVELLRHVAQRLASRLGPACTIGRIADAELGVILPVTDTPTAVRLLHEAARDLAAAPVDLHGESLRITPVVGIVTLTNDVLRDRAIERARDARDQGAAGGDLQPRVWDASLAHSEPQRRRLHPGVRLPLQILVTSAAALLVPFAAYWAAATWWRDVSVVAYLVIVGVLLLGSLLILIESVLAPRADMAPVEPGSPYPPASAIVAAYLPNEAATIFETLRAFLALDYPGGLEVLLAYNTDRPLATEQALRELEAAEPRLRVVRVADSTSKAQNVNAALPLARGQFVGVFDADHHPDPGSFTRAWRWLSNGYDVVQGHCLVRNGDATWLSRLVAVEFEAIYAVSHPGRARLHGFALFGGSNGYWRTDRLHAIRMRSSMLTEDIDSSMRVLEQGGRIASDARLVSRELGTTTVRQLWHQRLRWAQGWFQVSVRHLLRGLRSRALTPRQKLGLVHLLGWRELYPWLTLQMFPVIAFWLTWRGGRRLDWFVPLFVATTLVTLATGPVQTVFAYRRAEDAIRAHRRWFVAYAIASLTFYTEFKNLICRVAQLKQVMGERDWRVTPRDADPVPE